MLPEEPLLEEPAPPLLELLVDELVEEPPDEVLLEEPLLEEVPPVPLELLVDELVEEPLPDELLLDELLLEVLPPPQAVNANAAVISNHAVGKRWCFVTVEPLR